MKTLLMAGETRVGKYHALYLGLPLLLSCTLSPHLSLGLVLNSLLPTPIQDALVDSLLLGYELANRALKDGKGVRERRLRVG